MNVCSNCRAYVPAGAQRCPNCGAEFNTGSDSTAGFLGFAFGCTLLLLVVIFMVSARDVRHHADDAG